METSAYWMAFQQRQPPSLPSSNMVRYPGPSFINGMPHQPYASQINAAGIDSNGMPAACNYPQYSTNINNVGNCYPPNGGIPHRRIRGVGPMNGSGRRSPIQYCFSAEQHQQMVNSFGAMSLQNAANHQSAEVSVNESKASAIGGVAARLRTGKSVFFPNTSCPGMAETEVLKDQFSRKVFVGGLPPDIDEDEISAVFRRYGSLTVDWPHKAESKSYFPPKGYCFLIFENEASVHGLLAVCQLENDKYYVTVSSPTIKDKSVQIRPWRLADADFVLDDSLPLDPRKTVFVGGVPRPLRAIELATIMDRLYGGVCYAGIDTDPDLKYPKGAGRVAFSNQQSYIAAISARFVQLQHSDIDKRVEVKPYVLDDQICDECGGARSPNKKFAPFFCANVTCLQYYCEQCWGIIHMRSGREYHKPLVKEGADRPRAVPFRWM